MSNMSYVRFENTLRDLRDCAEHLDDELSQREKEARERLIRLCQEIARGDWGGDVEDDDE